MLRQVRPVLRNVTNISRISVRASSEVGHGHHKSPVEVARENLSTLNDIPIPQGSWQEHYNKRTSKWNMMLGASIVCFVATLYAMKPHVLFHTFPLSEMKKANIKVE